MESEHDRTASATFRPMGRLKARRGLLPWLVAWRGEDPDELRPAITGGLLSSPAAIILGAINGVMVAGLALYALGHPVFAVIMAAELALLGARLIVLKRVKLQQAGQQIPFVDKPIMLSIMWCSLQGILFFLGMASGDPAIMVIMAAHCMGLVGPLCARNYPAPRLALLLVFLCVFPLIGGAVSTGKPLMLALVALTPGFILGASQLIANYRGAMLVALKAELANDMRARHDPLTGLLNRNGLEAITAQLSQDRQMSLVCFDLDGFKPINDRFGHAAGDRLLHEVAQRMSDALPDGQVLARIGGDEFVALLHDYDPDMTNAAIDRIIARVSGTPYVAEGTHLVEIGITAGFACHPEDSTSVEELQILADRALYAAKEAGKGFASRWNPPLAA